jgi:hypothetical protein
MMRIVKVKRMSEHPIEQRCARDWKLVLKAHHRRFRSLAESSQRLHRLLGEILARSSQSLANPI